MNPFSLGGAHRAKRIVDTPEKSSNSSSEHYANSMTYGGWFRGLRELSALALATQGCKDAKREELVRGGETLPPKMRQSCGRTCSPVEPAKPFSRALC